MKKLFSVLLLCGCSTIPEPPLDLIGTQVWYHKTNPGEEVLALVESTFDTGYPVRWMPFLHKANMVKEIGEGEWELNDPKLRATLIRLGAEIKASGYLMQDFEGFRITDSVAPRLLEMEKVDAVVEEYYPDILHGWYRIPDHGKAHRFTYTNALKHTNCIFIAIHTKHGDDLVRYHSDIQQHAPSHSVVIYLTPSKERDGEILTDDEILIKVREALHLWPGAQLVVRSDGPETANMIRVIRAYLMEN